MALPETQFKTERAKILYRQYKSALSTKLSIQEITKVLGKDPRRAFQDAMKTGVNIVITSDTKGILQYQLESIMVISAASKSPQVVFYGDAVVLETVPLVDRPSEDISRLETQPQIVLDTLPAGEEGIKQTIMAEVEQAELKGPHDWFLLARTNYK